MRKRLFILALFLLLMGCEAIQQTLAAQTISTLSPSSAIAGSQLFTLTVNGSGFRQSSVVFWNGQPRDTTFVNATQLQAQILASDIAGSGMFSVTVKDTPNTISFTVTAPPTPPGKIPTSVQFTVAPCDANWNCTPGTTAAFGQTVQITVHVVYLGAVKPTGQLCILDNGTPAAVGCGLTPVTDESWFAPRLASGSHALEATYSGDGTYSGSRSGTTTLTVGSAPPPAAGCPAAGTGSFTGCYYSGIAFSRFLMSRTDPQINFDWGAGSPDTSVPLDQFSVRWQGNFTFVAGTYLFTITTDDGMRLYVDGALLLDKWFDQAATTYTAPLALSAGSHAVKVEYYENAGNSVAKVSWAASVPAPLAILCNGQPSPGFCAMPDGQVGVPYSYQLQVTGGVPPYTWSILSGSPAILLGGPGLLLAMTAARLEQQVYLTPALLPGGRPGERLQ